MRPAYAAAFACIGPECEDPCCQGWEIPLDRQMYERYQLFPVDKLGWAVDAFVKPTLGVQPPSLYAHIEMTASGDCPFYDSDRLCGVQKTYGADFLSATCSAYPRTLNRVDGVLEGSLLLSCPEAARGVLLDENYLQRVGELESGDFRTDNFFRPGAGPGKVEGDFLLVREAIIAELQDRTRPNWLRLLRVGAFCAFLQAGIPAEQVARQAQENEWDRELELLPGDARIRLELMLRLSADRVKDPTSGRRFEEVYWKFVKGISGSQNVPLSEQAQRTSYDAFVRKHPYAIENYLVNYVNQRLFPYGRAGGAADAQRSIFEEFILMASLFVWVETLVIGVAAHEGDRFSGAHLVEVVQAFCRSVEHYPGVLEQLLQTMRKHGLDSLAGMARMLRP